MMPAMASPETEETERKALPQRVQVVIRVRPPLNGENGADVTVTAEENSRVQVLLPSKDGEKERLATQPSAKAFEFDKCLGPDATQEDVYEACNMEALVDAALEGYSITLFAYGQTGSGKTHSIVGPRIGQAEGESAADVAAVTPEDGVLSRAFAYAFAAMQGPDDVVEYSASLSCSEIYNDQVSDLFRRGQQLQNLPIRYDKAQGFYVEGLSSKPVNAYSETMGLMHRALSHRQMGSHNLNKTSTRSHCIMTLLLEGRRRDEEGKLGSVRYGRLSLVDLAGSERIKETGTSGQKQLAETGSINRSLFALGKVIAALCQRAKGNPNVFVPFRDSKLTQLLYSSLRGTGRALMLGCCAPTKAYAEETLNTLQFASMALRVKSEPIVILDPQEQMLLDLKNTIAELRSENKRMAEALSGLSQGLSAEEVLRSLMDPNIPPSGGNGRRLSAPSHGNVFRPASQGHQRSRSSGPGPRNTRSSGGDKRYNRLSSSPAKSAGQRLSERLNMQQAAPPRQFHTLPPSGSEEEEFPELAALEAAFQARLAGVTSGDEYTSMAKASPSVAPSNNRASAGQELAALLMADMDGGFSPSEASTSQLIADPPGRNGAAPGAMDAAAPLEPEPKAVQWAKRNRWFGTDQEMTTFAYDVHEQLVGAEGVSAESDEYYTQLDRQIAERFPPSRVGRALPPSSPVKPRSHSQRGRGFPLSPQSGFSARTSIKAPLPSFTPSDSPKYAGRAAGVRRRLADMNNSSQGSSLTSSSGRQAGAATFDVARPSVARGVVSSGSARSRGGVWDDHFNSRSYSEYRRDVLIDLRAAKEEAEAERKRILQQIGRTLHRRWN